MRRQRLVLTVTIWVVLVSIAQAQEFGRDEKKLDISDCPKVIQKSLRQEANKGKIGEVILKTESGVSVYETNVQLEDLNYAVLVRPDGVLVSKVLNRGEEDGSEKNGPAPVDGDDIEKKSPMKMAGLPKKVQKTLKQEGRGGEIDDLVKVEKGNEVFYRAEAEIGDRDYRIEIGDDGTLRKKVLAKGKERDSEDEEEDDVDPSEVQDLPRAFQSLGQRLAHWFHSDVELFQRVHDTVVLGTCDACFDHDPGLLHQLDFALEFLVLGQQFGGRSPDHQMNIVKPTCSFGGVRVHEADVFRHARVAT
jgi:hypothetical protein